MKNNTNKILGFAVFAAFLIISVSLTPAISAEPVMLTNNIDKKIGDYVKVLVENNQIRSEVTNVLENLDKRNVKIEALRRISNVVQYGLMKSTFQELTDEIYSIHSEEFDRLNSRNSDSADHPEDLPDYLESDDVLIQDVFEFSFIKPNKGLFKNNFFNRVLEILQKIPYLEKLLNLRNKETVGTNERMSLETSNTIPLYHAGSSNPIIQGPLYKINAFLLLLEVAVKDLSSGDFDLDSYCSELNLASDIRTDEELMQDIEIISANLNIRTRTYNLLSLSKEQGNEEINSIIDDIENHECYQQIVQKFEEYGIDVLLTPFGIPIAVIFWLLAAGCFALGAMIFDSFMMFGDYPFFHFFYFVLFVSLGIMLTIVGCLAFIFL
jgi:hypothetical protein